MSFDSWQLVTAAPNVEIDGKVVLNGDDPFYASAPLWLVTDPRDDKQYLVREWTQWAAEEEADELLGLA
jgi:hypothetical protein